MGEEYISEILRDVRSYFDQHPSIEEAVVVRSNAGNVQLRDDRSEWTNALLNALASAARNRNLRPEPTRLYLTSNRRNSPYDDPERKDDVGEFMVDMSWWPDTMDGELWWNTLPANALRCILAVESEWGWMESGDYEQHIDHAAIDFCKLLVMNAEHRLFITCCDSSDRERFLQVLSNLREAAGLRPGDAAVWLWDVNDSWESIAQPHVAFP